MDDANAAQGNTEVTPPPETADKDKPRAGAPKRNKNARKSGYYALDVSLKRDGFAVLSRNQREAVQAWKAAVVSDLGGLENLSQLKQFQLQRYLVTEVLIQSVDAWLMQQPTLINKRKKQLIPIMNERNRLVETSAKLAQLLGLDRQAPVKNLNEYLKSRSSQEEQ